VNIKKIILTEQSIYYGDVNMPKGFEIDKDKLANDIFTLIKNTKETSFTRNLSLLNTYIKDYMDAYYNKKLVNKDFLGSIFKPYQISEPLQEVDPVDLKNSADFTLVYGVKVNECFIKIFYDDNRRKGRSWDIKLENNMFVLFPSTNKYIILNKQKENLNFIQTITFFETR